MRPTKSPKGFFENISRRSLDLKNVALEWNLQLRIFTYFAFTDFCGSKTYKQLA